MHTEGTAEIWPGAKWVEGILLLAGAPFLLFPEQSIILTTGALVIIVLLWLWPVFFLRKPLIPTTPFNLILLLFIFMLLVGILVTADPWQTLPKASGIILGLSAWRYITIYVDRRSLFSWTVTGFIFLGIAMTLLGFLNADWLLKSTSQVPLIQELETITLSDPIAVLGTGSGIHPNQIAGSIMLYLPLLFSLIIGSPTIRQHKWLLIATVFLTFLVALTLLLTQSRSGWLGFLGGIWVLFILWALLLPPSWLRRVFGTLALLMPILAIALILQQGPARLIQLWLDPPQETAIGSLATLNFRQEIWPWALSAVRDFPFTGTGLGAFRAVGRRLYPIQVVETFDFAHAHNVFLQMTVDLGIPGLISYISLLIIAFTIGWQISRRDLALRPIGIGILSGLFAFHVYGLTDTLAIGSKPSLLFWIMIALLAAANRLSSRSDALLGKSEITVLS